MINDQLVYRLGNGLPEFVQLDPSARWKTLGQTLPQRVEMVSADLVLEPGQLKRRHLPSGLAEQHRRSGKLPLAASIRYFQQSSDQHLFFVVVVLYGRL